MPKGRTALGLGDDVVDGRGIGPFAMAQALGQRRGHGDGAIKARSALFFP